MVHESHTKTNPSPSGQPGDLSSPRKNPNHLANPCWSFERLKGVEVTLKCPTFFKIPSLTASLPLQNDGTGRRSFLFQMVTFQGQAVKLQGGNTNIYSRNIESRSGISINFFDSSILCMKQKSHQSIDDGKHI